MNLDNNLLALSKLWNYQTLKMGVDARIKIYFLVSNYITLILNGTT